jgi:TolB-like protein
LRSTPEGKQSIAVLPFENLSSEIDSTHFANGIADELLLIFPRSPD